MGFRLEKTPIEGPTAMYYTHGFSLYVRFNAAMTEGDTYLREELRKLGFGVTAAGMAMIKIAIGDDYNFWPEQLTAQSEK